MAVKHTPKKDTPPGGDPGGETAGNRPDAPAEPPAQGGGRPQTLQIDPPPARMVTRSMDQESNKNAGSTNPEVNAPPTDNANAASNKETEGVKSLSSFGVPTLTHTKDGKKIVL